MEVGTGEDVLEIGGHIEKLAGGRQLVHWSMQTWIVLLLGIFVPFFFFFLKF